MIHYYPDMNPPKNESKSLGRRAVWNPSAVMLRRQKAALKRLTRSDKEIDKALTILKAYPKRVTIFGSARDLPTNEAHRDIAYVLSYKLAKDGYAVVSGGGNGIMAASNKGAYDAGGVSIGFNITLPHEQKLNPYTTHSFAFHYFFSRKVTMTFFSHAYVYFPGGFGTLDELTEIITLIQTKKMPPLRVVLVGKEYWQGFDVFVKKHLLENGYISSGDEQLYAISDDPDEILHLINTGYDS